MTPRAFAPTASPSVRPATRRRVALVVFATFLSIAAGARVAWAAAPGAHRATVNSTMTISGTSRSAAEVFLGGNFLELAVNPSGAFGSHNTTKPAGFIGSPNRSQIGMVTDVDGFGVGTTQSFDYFMPGSPYVGWMAGYKISGVATTGKNTNDSTSGLTMNMPTTLTDTGSGNTLSATAVSTLGGKLQVTQVIEFGVNDKFFKITVTLKNISAGAIDSARYLWIVDPDNVQDLVPEDPFGDFGSGGFTTQNTLVHTIAAGDAKAVIEAATVSSDPVQTKLVLYTTDTRARANYGYLSGIYSATAYDTTPAKGSTSTNDEHMWMTWDAGTLAAGASTTFSMFVSLSNQSFADFESAIGGNSNSAPTDLALSSTAIGKSAGANATVGSLSSTDANSGDTFTYSLVSGTGSTDNALFNISGSTLRANNPASLNVGTYSVRIRTTDSGAGTYEEAFTITVTDDVAPTISSAAVPSDGTYRVGQNLDFTVTYSEAVTVNSAGGTPYVTLTLDSGGAVQAAYLSGSGTSSLTFRYTVASGAVDTTGVAAAASITLNGGTIRDASGNNAALTSVPFASTASVLVDGGAPTASSIVRANTSPTTASSIGYTVTFSEAVSGVDSGDFSLTATGTAAGTVTSVSAVSGSEYSVTLGSVSGDGTLRLDLNSSGTGITDTSGNAISGGFTSGQVYAVDRTAPQVASVSVPANGAYAAGQNLDFTVTFGENVTVNTSGGTPSLALTIGSAARTAAYVSGSGTSSLVFRYTVQTGELDSNGIAVGSSLTLNGATFRDSSGNDAVLTLNSVGSTAAVLIDAVAPTIDSVTAPTAGAYRAGQNLDFTVTLSEPATVNATGGTPTLVLTVGTATRAAAYVSGSGSTTLVFRYTVQAGDDDSNGITSASPLTLNGGTLRDAAGNNAVLTFIAPDTAAVLVDTTAPTVTSVAATTANGSYKAGGTIDLVVHVSEVVAVVTTGGTPLLTLETGTTDRTASYVSGSGTTALTFRYTVQAGDTSADLDYASTSALALNSATIKDAAGNDAALTLAAPGTAHSLAAAAALVIDTTAPDAPAIATIGDDTGANTSDGMTSDQTLLFNGTAEANSTVTVSRTGTGVIGTATANNSGAWTVDYTGTTLAAGTYGFTATATDAAGNTSTASTAFSVTIDTAAPAVPAFGAISDDTGSSNSDAITSDTTLVLTGTAEARSSVNVARTGTGVIGTVNANENGAWTFDYSATALPAGTHDFTATATDSSGNSSAASAALRVTIDTAAPNAPIITAITDDTGSSTADFVTSDTTLVLNGTAEANSIVAISRVGAGQIGTATANESGAWSFDYTGTTLGAGEHSFAATATDRAGNTSTASTALIVTVDSATAAPVITGISEDTGGSTTDGRTSDATLVLNGTAEANSTVTVHRSGAGAIGTATANNAGAWSFDYTGTTLADASYIFTATATDAAGNASATSADFPVVIDAAAPAAPAIVAISDDTGASTSDGITRDATLAFAGTAEANARVSITRVGIGVIGNVTANNEGAWSFDYTATTLSDGTHTFTATATDSAGNNSVASADFNVTVDTVAPSVDSSVAANGAYGSAFSHTLTASGSPASFSATGLPDGLTLDTATGAITGTPAQSGTFTVTVNATDAAGNTGTGSLALSVAKAPLTVSGVVAQNKTYDRTTTATLNFSGAALVGVIGTDAVALDTSAATGAFADRNVGAGKTVTVSGLSLTGAAATHYALSQPTTTAAITAQTLTVAGLTAADKVFDGSSSATLSAASAALTGAVAGDDVTLVTSGATGAFASTNAGSAVAVTISGLALSGADAANYALTQPAISANITKASASISIGNLAHTYNGAPKHASVSVTPAGVGHAITYNGNSAAPTNAGTYFVQVTVNDPNYSGSASGSLTIAKTAQSIAFSVAGSATVGSPVALSATASSGLPVSFSVVSGSATIAGNALTITAAGNVTVRATQGGNDNFLPATAEQTIADASRLAQTIAFATLTDKRATDAAFALEATATSGLPVTFTVLSGPALVSGSTLTLSGIAGTVTVRASQAGDAVYEAAPDVTHSFTVTPVGVQVFFGQTTNNDTIAASVRPDNSGGTIIGYVAATGEGFVVNFALNAEQAFQTQASTFSSAAAGVVDAAAPRRAAAAGTRTFRGRISNGMLSGEIVELGLAFSADVQPRTGPTAEIAGYYHAASTNTAAGSTYSVVGTLGRVYVLAITPTVVVAGDGAVRDNHTFAVQASQNATISGAIDQPSATVTGSITLPGKPEETFAGTNVAAVRTDRLVNLSSRVRVGPAANRTLITGFVIGGTTAKRVLLRAVGPTLSDFGVNGALGNPRLELYNAAGERIRENEDWSGAETAAAFAQVGAFTLANGARDAALLATLEPGAYTMHVKDSGETGVALAEIYDASANPQGEYQRLVNISTRGTVESGEGVLIGGFVVTGNAPKRVLVRGVGPALGGFGLDGVLADPQLAVFSGSTVVAQNNDWSVASAVTPAQIAATAAEIAAATRVTGAFAFAPGSKDAAVIVTLAPGAYTAQVTGAGGTTGVALVEIYEIPE